VAALNKCRLIEVCGHPCSVKQEYDEDRAMRRRERDSLKNSLEKLRRQEQTERDRLENFQREYQLLHSKNDDLTKELETARQEGAAAEAKAAELLAALETLQMAHAAGKAEVPRPAAAEPAAGNLDADIPALDHGPPETAATVAAAAAVAAAAEAGVEAGDSVVLEGLYGENYEPMREEVLEAAEQLGIDAAAEERLMWIARKALKAPLPEGWRPCASPEGEVYFFNFDSGESVWERPLDQQWRELYMATKAKPAAEQGDPDPDGGPTIRSLVGSTRGGVSGSVDDSEEDDEAEPRPPLPPLPLVRPAAVPALDFELLAKIVAEQEAEDAKEEEEATVLAKEAEERVAALPLPVAPPKRPPAVPCPRAH
jgi:centrosomal protein CEP164